MRKLNKWTRSQRTLMNGLPTIMESKTSDLTFEEFEFKLMDSITNSLIEIRKLEIKKGCYKTDFSDSEIIGEYCNWLRRNFTRHKLMDSSVSLLASVKSWYRPGVPSDRFWGYKNIVLPLKNGTVNLYLPYLEKVCKMAEKKSWDSQPLENQFTDIKVGMDKLFSELTELQVLSKMATCINAEASVVLENLYKSVEKLES